MEGHSSNKLLIPQRFNQKGKFEEYFIDTCSNDQKDVLAYILPCFKKWNEIENNPDSQETFTPLRMRLCGVAGSDKSTLINTLVTAIQKITQKNNSVYMDAPTGSAVFNAGGETCHHLFNIQGNPQSCQLSGQALRTLIS